MLSACAKAGGSWPTPNAVSPACARTPSSPAWPVTGPSVCVQRVRHFHAAPHPCFACQCLLTRPFFCSCSPSHLWATQLLALPVAQEGNPDTRDRSITRPCLRPIAATLGRPHGRLGVHRALVAACGEAVDQVAFGYPALRSVRHRRRRGPNVGRRCGQAACVVIVGVGRCWGCGGWVVVSLGTRVRIDGSCFMVLFCFIHAAGIVESH